MNTCSSQEFGPAHPYHSNVSWPAHLESTICTLPSSFIPLLENNAPPSKYDALRIREFKDPILASLEQTKHHPDSNTLSRQLEKQVLACDVMLSPFRSLPNDILYQITSCCPMFIRRQAPHPRSPVYVLHFPSILSEVCKGWHTAVHSMSRMWSEILMGSFHWGSDALEVLQQRCALFAQRSGILPLSLNLSQTKAPGCDTPYEESRPEFLKALEWVWNTWDHPRRSDISKLSLSIDGDVDFLIDTLSVLGCNQPKDGLTKLTTRGTLKSLRITGLQDDEIRGYHLEEDCLGEIVLRIFNDLPYLLHLSFDAVGIANLHYGIYKGGPVFPHRMYTALKTIHLVPSLSISDLWVLLTACPHLEVATLTIHTLTFMEESMPSAICAHQEMKELELKLLIGEEHNDFLESCIFRFPNLHRLAFEWGTVFSSLDLGDVQAVDADAFFEAFQAIETLEFKYAWTDLARNLELYNPIFYSGGILNTTRSVRVCLYGMGQLQTALEFFNARFAESESNERGDGVGDVEFLPRLEHLVLEISPEHAFDIMVEERRDTVASSVLEGLRCIQGCVEMGNAANGVGNDDNRGLEDASVCLGEDLGEGRCVKRLRFTTTVRYIWGRNHQNEDSAERQCFMDWETQFTRQGDRNGVVVEVVRVRARERGDIIENEIFDRFEI